MTSGSATQTAGAAQAVIANLPPTHCAKLPLTHAFSPSVHADEAVKVANFALSACAAWPLESAKPVEEVATAVVAAGAAAVAAAAEVATAVSVLAATADEWASIVAAGADEPEIVLGTPGFDVISVSCVPSAMGPEGFAGQEPSGLSGAVSPNGMVPG